jgi:hypothetical protein
MGTSSRLDTGEKKQKAAMVAWGKLLSGSMMKAAQQSGDCNRRGIPTVAGFESYMRAARPVPPA